MLCILFRCEVLCLLIAWVLFRIVLLNVRRLRMVLRFGLRFVMSFISLRSRVAYLSGLIRLFDHRLRVMISLGLSWVSRLCRG